MKIQIFSLFWGKKINDRMNFVLEYNVFFHYIYKKLKLIGLRKVLPFVLTRCVKKKVKYFKVLAIRLV